MLMEFLRNLAMGAVADEVRKTPQGKSIQEQYVAPVANSIMDALIPPAAASDASTIPQQGFKPIVNEVPADRVMTQEEEQLVTPRVKRADGVVEMPTITMQEPTQPPMVDVTDEQQVKNVHDFTRKAAEGRLSAGDRITATAKKLQQEVPHAKPEETIAMAVVQEIQKGDLEPLDIAAMNEGQLMPADKPLTPDQEEFLARKYDNQPKGLIEAVKAKNMADAERAQMTGQAPDYSYLTKAREMSTAENQQMTGNATPVEAPKQEPGFFEQIGSGLKDFFGNEAAMLALARSFNSLRHKPDEALGAALSKRLGEIQERKGSGATIAELVRMKRLDLARLVEAGQLTGKEAMAMALKNPKTTYRTMTYGEYARSQGMPVPEGMENELVNVSSQGEITPFYDKPVSESLVGEMSKALREEIPKVYNAARNAENNILKIDELINLIETQDPNMGMFATLKQARDKFITELGGEEAAKRASDTEVLDAFLGSEVFDIFAAIGLGARGLDTPAEREFLRQVMTGKITFTPEALVRLAKRRRREQLRALDTYHDYKEGEAMRTYTKKLGAPEINITSDQLKEDTYEGFSIVR